jgi:hypothetical protein
VIGRQVAVEAALLVSYAGEKPYMNTPTAITKQAAETPHANEPQPLHNGRPNGPGAVFLRDNCLRHFNFQNPMQLVMPPSPFMAPEAVIGMGVYSAKAVLEGKGRDVWEMIAENVP